MPASVPFNDKTIFTSDGLLKLDDLPKTMIVVGGGVIGVEYACMLATLGVKVTLVEGRSEVLGFLDHEITEAFQYQMRRMGITLRLGEKVAKIEEISPDHPEVQQAAAVPTATAASCSGERSERSSASAHQSRLNHADGHVSRQRSARLRWCRRRSNPANICAPDAALCRRPAGNDLGALIWIKSDCRPTTASD